MADPVNGSMVIKVKQNIYIKDSIEKNFLCSGTMEKYSIRIPLNECVHFTSYLYNLRTSLLMCFLSDIASRFRIPKG